MKKTLLIFLGMLLLVTLFAKIKGEIYVNSASCVSCGDCEKLCPTNAIQIIDGKAIIDQEECIQCQICVKACTYEAIRKSE